MDELMKQKITDLANDIVKETGGSEGKAIALSDRVSDILLSMVRDIIQKIPSNKDLLS